MKGHFHLNRRFILWERRLNAWISRHTTTTNCIILFVDVCHGLNLLKHNFLIRLHLLMKALEIVQLVFIGDRMIMVVPCEISGLPRVESATPGILELLTPHDFRLGCEGKNKLHSFPPLVGSSLNGNNGEWTNGDDMSSKGAVAYAIRQAKRELKAAQAKKESSPDVVVGDGKIGEKSPQQINDDNKRNHKSAAAHQIHSQLGSKHSKVQPGAIVPEIPQEQKESEVVEVPMRRPPTIGVIMLTVREDVSFDGYSYERIFFIAFKGKEIEVVTFDPTRYFIQHSEIVEFVEIPPFTMFGQVFPKQYVQFSAFMYQHNMAKLKLLANEPRNYTAMQQFKIVTYRDLPRQFVDGNMVYYAFRCMTMLPKDSRSPVPSMVPYEHGISVNIVNTVNWKSTLGPVFEKYAYSGNWKLVKAKGFNITIENEEILYIGYDTTADTISTDVRTIFFQFTPRSQFAVYANCGENICGALARYFKELYPGEEHARKNNQLQLLAHFPRDIIEDTVKLCNGYVNSTPENTTIRSRFHCEVAGSEYNGMYTINHSASTGLFKKIIDQFFERAYWYLLWMWFTLWLCDMLGLMWNIVVIYVFTPMYRLYEYRDILAQWVTIPHPKRLLYTTFVTDSKILNWIVTNVGDIESKLKRELAKVGKVGRLYATGAHLALAEVVWPALLKWIFGYTVHHEVELGEDKRLIRFEAEYCPTQSAQSSDEMFAAMRNLPNNTVKFVYFSDDGFLTANIDGEHYIFETDFSSCDASNGLAVFTTFHYMARKVFMGEAAKRIISQCARSTKIFNPDAARYGKTEYCVWLPEFFFEYSGNSGTTCYNNIGGVGLFVAIIELMTLRDTYTIDPELIATAAKRYGWKVSVIPRASYNASTFLKRAYGSRSWLCYGAILRSWGHTDGPAEAEHFGITHREFKHSSTEHLSELLIRQKASELINEPSSPLIEAIRIRAGLQESPRPYVITYEDLAERYGLEKWEWAHLIDSILSLKLGDCITNFALEKIFEVDYGTTPVQDRREYTFTMGSFSGNKLT